MANTKVWTANENQVAFMDVLKGLGRAATLMEINAVAGREFKTGTINTLIAKGLVATEDTDVTYTETKKFVFGDKTVETTTEKTVTRKAYSLV